MPSRVLDQHPTINDDLPNRIISGRVQVKPNIREFTETSAIFEDGTREDIDAIVFATGYSFSFPFLEGFKVVENQIPLYKFMFPPDLEKPTLAFIGLIQPLGAIMPISELQCRWATYIFKGKSGQFCAYIWACPATPRLNCCWWHPLICCLPTRIFLSSFCFFIRKKKTLHLLLHCSSPVGTTNWSCCLQPFSLSRCHFLCPCLPLGS